MLENDERYSSPKPDSCSKWVHVKADGGRALHFRAPVTVFILPDCNPVLDFISSSKQRLYIIAPYIDFEWYRHGGLLDSIRQAKMQGAEVKVILNSQYASKESIETLREEGIEVFLTEKLHGKAIVSDNRLLITSANLNMYGLKLNREIGVIIDSSIAADTVVEEFEKGIGRKEITPLDMGLTLAAFLASIAIFRKMKDKL